MPVQGANMRKRRDLRDCLEVPSLHSTCVHMLQSWGQALEALKAKGRCRQEFLRTGRMLSPEGCSAALSYPFSVCIMPWPKRYVIVQFTPEDGLVGLAVAV